MHLSINFLLTSVQNLLLIVSKHICKLIIKSFSYKSRTTQFKKECKILT